MSQDSTEKSVFVQGMRDLGARRTPRRLYRRPMGLLVAGHYEVFEGRTLSEGGVSLQLHAKGEKNPKMKPEELPPGSHVAVTLILPSGSSFILRGEVVYHNDETAGHLVGIKFESVPLQQRREIRNYVSSKQAGEADL